MHDHGSVVKIIVIFVGHCTLLKCFGSTACVVNFVAGQCCSVLFGVNSKTFISIVFLDIEWFSIYIITRAFDGKFVVGHKFSLPSVFTANVILLLFLIP